MNVHIFSIFNSFSFCSTFGRFPQLTTLSLTFLFNLISHFYFLSAPCSSLSVPSTALKFIAPCSTYSLCPSEVTKFSSGHVFFQVPAPSLPLLSPVLISVFHATVPTLGCLSHPRGWPLGAAGSLVCMAGLPGWTPLWGDQGGTEPFRLRVPKSNIWPTHCFLLSLTASLVAAVGKN